MSDQYPLRLLPQKEYRSKLTLTDTKDIYLQRKCFLSFEECCIDGDPNSVSPHAFGNSGLHNLSVNILGGLFRIGDEKWHQLVDETDNWEKGDVDLNQYADKYEQRDVRVSVYFKWDDANQLKWKFPRAFNSEEERKEYREAIEEGMSEPFSKKIIYQVNAHSECRHAPNCLNYWHAEVCSIIDKQPKELVESNKGFRKKVLHGLIEELRVLCTLTPPSDFASIPEEAYKS